MSRIIIVKILLVLLYNCSVQITIFEADGFLKADHYIFADPVLTAVTRKFIVNMKCCTA
jgi:hypothetical protein